MASIPTALDAQSMPKGLLTTNVVQDSTADQIKTLFYQFLKGKVIKEEVDTDEFNPYRQQLDLIGKTEKNTFHVDFADLQAYHPDLSAAILNQYYRFEPYLRKAVQKLVEEFYPRDITATDRVEKEYWVSFQGLPSSVIKIRDLKTNRIGKLQTVKGTVTRSSEVRPELLYGRFICLECATLSDPIEQQFKYTEPSICRNTACSNRSKWQLDLEQSKFVDWQRLKVQENANEIPSGSMPRTLDVILRNECVEMAKAGDKCMFTGTLIVVPDVGQMIGEKVEAVNKVQGKGGNDLQLEGLTGLKALGVKDLNYKLCFLCNYVQPADGRVKYSNKSEEDPEHLLDVLSHSDVAKIIQMKTKPDIYHRLVKSIAPNTFGHEEIKKGILLMLFGGVHKTTEEGINLRGDINVCIVGDPSTSKSQFLKYVASLLPRAVYTSGKASSAAGLTASVSRDSETGEFGIEAGALMLADNGVCCIDEFDKMDLKDQVAIHEAMEQQTISIAKAGIRATLNARASILAAANPIGGRYNKKKTLQQNLGVSPAIMSRFDLFFVVLDDADEYMDMCIARHIVKVHQKKAETIQPEYSPEDLKMYIRYARSIKPQITKESYKLLVESYRKLRINDRVGRAKSYRMTVRQLESLIRLSEALARVHCDQEVKPSYVNEAVRLLRTSITTVDEGMVGLTEDVPRAVPASPSSNEDNQRQEEEEQEGEEGNQQRHSKRARKGHEDDHENNKNNNNQPKKEKVIPKKVKEIPMEYYRKISRLIVHHLRKQADDDGVAQAALIAWLADQTVDSAAATEAELIEHVKTLELIVNRLVSEDHVLLVCEEGASISERKLVVHPNYFD